MDAEKYKKLILTNDAGVCMAVDGAHGVAVLQRQQNDEWCDILLFGKDESSASQGIKAHKSILASASPHFHEAFTSSGFLDSGAKEYRVAQIDHTTLQLIVDFIYQSALRIGGKNIGEQSKLVLIGADYLLMPDLVYICSKILDDPKYLNIDSAIELWLFARKYRCEMLETAAISTCASDLSEVATQYAYLTLSRTDVVSLLKSLAVAAPRSSDLVCEAATAWLSCKETERQADCNEVMRQIPLKSMSANALRRLSEMKFLSEHVLWAVHQVHEVRVEVDEMEDGPNAKQLGSQMRCPAAKKQQAKRVRSELQDPTVTTE